MSLLGCLQQGEGDQGGLTASLGDLEQGSSPGWWATTVVTSNPSIMVEHRNLSQPISTQL